MTSRTIIAALVATNFILLALLAREFQSERVSADHLRRVRLDVQNGGNLELLVADSKTDAETTLVLTPRAALQVQHELGVMIQKITELAERARQAPEVL